MIKRRFRRKWLVPEVVQTSSLDCGPASLKCLLEGFGHRASYGRLREACQTSVDGTSIDSIEAVANQLGLAAEQMMLPPDHLFLQASDVFPALVVVTIPPGITHFVVLWRRYGSLLQIMDPAVGRRWTSVSQFLPDIYCHSISVPARDWREFAASQGFQAALGERMRRIGISSKIAQHFIEEALADASWRSAATLDAAVRFADSERKAGHLQTRAAADVLKRLLERPEAIPAGAWSVQSEGAERAESLLMRGAVVLRVRPGAREVDPAVLPAELAAALTERAASPARELLRFLAKSKRLGAGLGAGAALAAAAAVALEALLFQAISGAIPLPPFARQGGTLGAIFALACLVLLLEIPATHRAFRLGRLLEGQFRAAFFSKLSKLSDCYFRSRLASDMAERIHLAHRLRGGVLLVYRALRIALEMAFTAAALIWLAPAATVAILGVCTAGLLPLILAQPVLAERDLRVRTHCGALTRFYLDAMLGLTMIRSHGAERAMTGEHSKLLARWTQAARHFYAAASIAEGIQLAASFTAVAQIVLTSRAAAGPGRMLLAAYWALNLPALAQELGTLARQYPYQRNLTLRLLEPLGAPEEAAGSAGDAPEGGLQTAPAISFRGVSVTAGGHAILDGIDLDIEPGEHVAILGSSGAGKSSLAAVLLGWLAPAAGSVLVNGRPLDCETLRRMTAWIDPAVHVWNRSLAENIAYGNEPDGVLISQAAETALLRRVVSKLPQGFATPLGEAGGLLSGGEAQRVRLARALARSGVRLVILDEAFRGLDRGHRREFLARARRIWRGCTLLCITHDIAETRSFDRVVVIEAGRIAEQGTPAELRVRARSRYSSMLAAEVEAQRLWASGWRRVRVHSGKVVAPDVPVGAAAESELHIA